MCFKIQFCSMTIKIIAWPSRLSNLTQCVFQFWGYKGSNFCAYATRWHSRLEKQERSCWFYNRHVYRKINNDYTCVTLNTYKFCTHYCDCYLWISEAADPCMEKSNQTALITAGGNVDNNTHCFLRARLDKQLQNQNKNCYRFVFNL